MVGVNWGGQVVLCVGQEVLIDFIEGDIDCLVVIGMLYNGCGQDNVQGNQVGQGVGVVIGNVLVWFFGDVDGYQYVVVFFGIKIQVLGVSQSGGGVYN